MIYALRLYFSCPSIRRKASSHQQLITIYQKKTHVFGMEGIRFNGKSEEDFFKREGKYLLNL